MIEYGQMVFNCSSDTKNHIVDCPGNCGKRHLTNLEVDLYNEKALWIGRGYSFDGVPTPLKGGPWNGILVDIFEVQMKLEATMKLLVDKGLVTKEEANESYQQFLLNRMQAIRKRVEAERAKQSLAVAQTKILGPNGEVMN